MEAWTRLVRALGPAATELALRPPATETDLFAPTDDRTTTPCST